MRTTFEPTDRELAQLLLDDPIGRNAQLAYLLRLIDTADDGLSVFLDCGWGSGKTYFVRQARLLLSWCNPKLQKRERVSGMSDGHVEAVLGGTGEWRPTYKCLPVYFNSWENDSFGDPVMTITLSIAESCGIDTVESAGAGAVVRDIACSLATTLIPGGVDYGDVLQKIKGEDPFAAYRERKQLEERVGKLIRQALESVGAERLVLFVDELDRCRPTYAIEVLESVKHLLSRNDTVVVFSTNVDQLAHTVQGMYGANYDARGYLKRFADIQTSLDRPAAQECLALMEFGSREYSDRVAAELIEAMGLSLREVAQYREALARTSHPSLGGHSQLALFARDTLRAVLLCFEAMGESSALEALTHAGPVPDEMLRDVARLRVVADRLDTFGVPEYWEAPLRDQPATELREALLADLVAVYLMDEHSFKHREAIARFKDDLDLPETRKALKGFLTKWGE